MRALRGFTLIELLVTIAVLAILITIATQNYSRIVAEQALVTSGERLSKFLSLANSLAKKENKKVYVHFCQKASSSEWAMGLSDLSNCDCFTANSCLLSGREQISELSDGKVITTSQADITFGSLRTSYTPMRFTVDSGRITLTNTFNQKLTVIQSAMRLRICTPDDASLGYQQC